MQTKDLAALIVYHRKASGLSQSELADHAGVSRYVVQDLEAGKGRTTWGKLQAVLAVLNVRFEPEGPLVESWRKTLSGGHDE